MFKNQTLVAVTAALAIANIVKSSLGPVGLDKMLVDDVGDTTVTNDGATILKLLEVQHPAGKVCVEEGFGFFSSSPLPLPVMTILSK